MPVRDFVDAEGRAWKAWDVRPEAIHPATKAEDYLADCYIVGWIVFETASGREKRRLCPWPARWAESTDDELRAMLARADRVPPHKLDAERQVDGKRPPHVGEVEVPPDEDVPDITDLIVVRTIRYPRGRFWAVGVIAHPEGGGAPVLRFTAGMRFIDLKAWPRDWADLPDEQLVELLRLAAPRHQTNRPAGAPDRRWSDSTGDEGTETTETSP